MKYISEYQNAEGVKLLTEKIRNTVTRPWKIMDVCGGQTHSILRYALDTLIPPTVTLLHGPGCPVCVTPGTFIDRAIAAARRPEHILCTFGDLLRIPGESGHTLREAQASGGDVRMIYSPLECLDMARQNPDRTILFLAIGFETTAPANAMLIQAAKASGISNLRVLVSQYRVPPILDLICRESNFRPDAFLAPGHVCAVTGTHEYQMLCDTHHIPIAVTGFEPIDILGGILDVLTQLESGNATLTMPYARAVRPDGNPVAWRQVLSIFETGTREWRGLGRIPNGALVLRKEHQDFELTETASSEKTGACTVSLHCPAKEILLGEKTPLECPHFATACTPDAALGPSMVSPEGACAAFFIHRRT